MLYTEYISIKNVVVHFVGNKLNQDDITISKGVLDIDSEKEKTLLDYYLSSFQTEEHYQFYHDSNLELNEVYSYISQIFDKPEDIYKQSINLAKHLYNSSVHPKIKGGEFYVVYFKDCILDGDNVDAIGLFKAENKDTFLKILLTDGIFNLETESGTNIKKLDKGCLIFNKEKENGFIVEVVDNINKSIEAQFWIDNFLHVRSRKNAYSNTENVMTMAKKFVMNELPKDYEISKNDQIDLLNKSLEFFKEKEEFNLDDFTNDVISEPEIIEKFNQYKLEFEQHNDLIIDDQFIISEPARKKQQRSYKRVIRLDNKIRIVIDGNSNHIQQGEDGSGKYYKIYYKEEL